MAEQVRSLLQSLPSLIILVFTVKLLYNELFHIIVEQVKVEQPVTEDRVIEAVRRYTSEYGGPATLADVMYYIAPEQVRRPFESWWSSDAGRRAEREVRETLENLARQGRLRKVDGGYMV